MCVSVVCDQSGSLLETQALLLVFTKHKGEEKSTLIY